MQFFAFPNLFLKGKTFVCQLKTVSFLFAHICIVFTFYIETYTFQLTRSLLKSKSKF